MPSGHHRVAWDGLDASGHAMGAGVYDVTFAAGGRTFHRRLVMLK